VNPGVTRLVIVLALAVGGVAVLAQGFDAESAAAPTASPDPTSPSPTESPSPPPQNGNGGEVVGQQKGVLVQVLNGTFTPGLAGDFQNRLEDDQYLSGGDPTDAPAKPVVETVVYFRDDDSAEQAEQNEADARLLAETYLGDAAVEQLPRDYRGPDVTDPAADVIVVLGEDFEP
jgi:LytR cell envelope-related transcriptional attenuator